MHSIFTRLGANSWGNIRTEFRGPQRFFRLLDYLASKMPGKQDLVVGRLSLKVCRLMTMHDDAPPLARGYKQLTRQTFGSSRLAAAAAAEEERLRKLKAELNVSAAVEGGWRWQLQGVDWKDQANPPPPLLSPSPLPPVQSVIILDDSSKDLPSTSPRYIVSLKFLQAWLGYTMYDNGVRPHACDNVPLLNYSSRLKKFAGKEKVSWVRLFRDWTQLDERISTHRRSSRHSGPYANTTLPSLFRSSCSLLLLRSSCYAPLPSLLPRSSY